MMGFADVVTEAVAREGKGVDGVYHIGGVHAGVLVVVAGNLDALGVAGGKVGAAAVGKLEVFTAVARVGFGVVVADETAGAAHHKEAHEFAPVVGVFAFFKGFEGAEGGLMAADKFNFTKFAEEAFGADAKIGRFGDKEAKLAGEVEVASVVGGGGE